MAVDMLIHDTRVKASPPPVADNIYGVDSSTPLSHILAWTAVVADGSGGLRNLMFLCHGLPGFFQVGAEGITTTTVHLFGKLQHKKTPKVKNIVMYACRGADVDAKAGKSGKMLCAQIAGYSGANVFASDAIQSGYIDASHFIHLGNWEGAIFWFTPTGHWRAVDEFSLPEAASGLY